jgi:hypothetical protein
MIVAVIAVWMMQPTVNDIVNMIPVRHRFVTASGSVHVAVFLASGEPVLAAVRVGVADGDHVLVVVNQPVDLMRMVEMAIMQVVDVARVLQGLVSAAGSVAMIVVGVGMAVLAHQ